MGKVVDINSNKPHGSGEAVCFGCKHEWIAVAPIGITELECPSCSTMRGHFKFEYCSPPGTLVRTCECGNQYFYLTVDGHMCCNCGTYRGY